MRRLESTQKRRIRRLGLMVLSTFVGVAGCGGPTAGVGEGGAGHGGADQERGGLVATPAEISFDDALVGLSYETTVRLENGGVRDATIDWIIPWVPLDWAAWSVAAREKPKRLAPGESMEFSVRYSPTVAGEWSGEVWIETGESSEVVMSLSGRATLPPVVQAIEELDFGALEPGEERTLPVVVRNAGTGVLRVTSASLSGKQFTLEEIELSEGLGPYEETGAQLEIPITFTPSIPNGGYPDFGTLTLELEGGVRPAIDVNLVGSCTKIIEPPPF